jgi:pimeloyl-ACP methyl ester carboxylesterase
VTAVTTAPTSAADRGGPGWRPASDPLRDLLVGLAELPAAARAWSGLSWPGGEDAPVLVIPGFLADDWATLPLRAHLRRNGWAAVGWGLGRNHGRVGALLPPLRLLVSHLAEKHGQPVRIVGWSLGGVLGRELARPGALPIRQLITMGTPVVGGPKYTAYAGFYRMRGLDLSAAEAEVDARHSAPIPVPLDVIYTEQDGVVAWRASQDPRPGPRYAEHKVGGTHAGLIARPEVLGLVDRLLRQPVGG